MSSKLLAGRYELIEKIGDGGMAVVYKGKDRLLNRYVAIKILRPEFTKDEQFIENFRRESQAAAGLSHPNIVGVYDVGKEGNIYYIVMELIEGKVLSQIIKEKSRLDYKEAIHIVRQVASALSLAHKNQIVHRDVKPHNILITNTGVAKLADFGIAKAVSAATIVGGSNKVMGSVHYFSPEQARGAYVDERSDIYSLGIVLYEMLTGKVPFDGDNPVSIALMHINEDVPSVLEEVPGLPPQLEKIIHKATAKYQSSRYKSIDDMISDLDDIEFITKVMGKKAFMGEGTSVNVKEENEPAEKPSKAHKAEKASRPSKPKAEKPAKERKQYFRISEHKMTIFIVAACLILAAAGVFGFGSLMGWFGDDVQEIELPDFAGKTFEEAQSEGNLLGITVVMGQESFHPLYEAGQIISSIPSAGSTIMEGQEVKVNISRGKSKGVVPTLIEKDINEAITYAEEYGFKVNVTIVESHLPKDTVITQVPEGGKEVKSGTVIEIEVSDGKGKEKVKVPNLMGKTPDEANSLITEAGLKVGNVGFEETQEVAQNLVFWQEIEAGTEVEKNTPIGYLISKGEQPEGSGSGDFDMDLDIGDLTDHFVDPDTPTSADSDE